MAHYREGVRTQLCSSPALKELGEQDCVQALRHRIYAQYKNIVIRSWAYDDAKQYYRVVSDVETMRFISGGKPRSMAEAKLEVVKFMKELETQGWSRFAVSSGADGPCAGYVGYALKPDGVDFGGRCLRDFWGKAGYSTIACWLALDYGMSVVGFTRIHANIHFENHRARRMLELLGFTFKSIVDSPIGPHNRLEITRGDYFGGIRQKNRMLIDGLFGRRRAAPPLSEARMTVA